MLWALLRQAQLAVRLLREPRVPAVLKAVPAMALVYLVSPIDVIPDFLPGLGQLDDVGVLLAALELFVRMSPIDAAAHHREAILRRRPYSPMSSGDEVIEAEWRHG
jgi:uncharacterized membrane protein YkvA (DUF1232 family)